MQTISEKEIENFNTNGYIILDVIDKNKLSLLRTSLAKTIAISLGKYLPEKYKNFKYSEKEEDFILNSGMIELEKKNHKYLTDIYNQMPSSTFFYDIISDKKISSSINLLLGRDKNSNLYTDNTSMRMDTPGITPWIYGWHTDKSAGIPKSKFIQLWAPFTGRVEKNLGGLNVIKDSHKKKVKTEDDAIVRKLILSGEHARPRLDNKVIGANNKNEEIELFCEWGEGIFFNSNLMHKSGINKSTDRIRYVFTCFYHELYNPEWEFTIFKGKT